jgi:regulator of sigma E protease
MLVVLAILALGVLVIVHEAGHYFVAKWSKMRVERFSLGFGPAVLKWQSGETQFQLAPVPFGGFVQITGMNPHEEFDEKDPHVYPNRPAILRFLVILAGPAMNYLLSVVVIFVSYLSSGVQPDVARWQVQAVTAGAPAAGLLQEGDQLLKVNGVDVWYSEDNDRPDFRSEVQKSQGKPVVISAMRAGKPIDVTITPYPEKGAKSGEAATYKVGVGLEVPKQKVGLFATAGYALEYPVVQTQTILGNLKQIITRKVDPQVVGPVGIVDAMRTQFAHGWERALELIAILNVMLGLFNLLPIPGLDGGRLAFLGYELATRRRANPKVEATVHMFGILILFLVLIVVTFTDIRNLFT